MRHRAHVELHGVFALRVRTGGPQHPALVVDVSITEAVPDCQAGSGISKVQLTLAVTVDTDRHLRWDSGSARTWRVTPGSNP